MINKIQLNDKIRGLFDFTPLQYMLDAICENQRLAQVYTNDEQSSALILLGHYLFVGGNQSDELVDYFIDNAIPKERREILEVLIVFYNGQNDSWKSYIKDKFNDIATYYENERSLYRKKPNSVEEIKTTYDIRRITQELLNSDLDNKSMIVDEVIGTNTYDDMQDFTVRGIGFSLVVDNCIKGFCTSEYPSKNQIAIGIEVEEKYMKQGIATNMTKMLLNEAYKHDYTVYWECWKRNIASVNTALKCGFEKIGDYPLIFLDFDK